MREGYITSAYGRREFLDQAVTLACTIRTHDPNHILSIITDQYLASSVFDYQKSGFFDQVIVRKENELHGFQGKLIAGSLTPYDRTIFVDTDCLVVQKVHNLWEHYSSQDFCIQGSIEHSGTYGKQNIEIWLKKFNISYIPFFNAGCFSWNNAGAKILARALEILKDPSEYHIPAGTYGFPDDQVAIGVAMAENQLLPLSNSLDLHFSFSSAKNLDLDITKGYCGFLKGTYWTEPSVFHYNALISIDLYRSKSRRVLQAEINKIREKYRLGAFMLPKPNFRSFLGLIKNRQFRWQDNR